MRTTFLNYILYPEGRKDVLINAMFNYIDNNRHGLVVDERNFHIIGRMIMRMFGSDNESIYKQDFEPRFLQTSYSFYLEQSILIEKFTLQQYLEGVELMFNLEECEYDYLLPETRDELMKILISVLLMKPCEHVFEKSNIEDVHSIINENNTYYLRLMYNIFSRSDESRDKLAQMFSNHIESELNRLLVLVNSENAQKPEYLKDNIKNLIQYTKLMDSFVVDEFQNDHAFQDNKEEAFEKAIAEHTVPAKGLVLYLDELLSTQNILQTIEEPRLIIKTVFHFFKLIKDKDEFQTEYLNYLKLRISDERYCNPKLEDYVIWLLKDRVKPEYLDPIEKVRNDYFTTLQTNNEANLEMEISFDDDNDLYYRPLPPPPVPPKRHPLPPPPLPPKPQPKKDEDEKEKPKEKEEKPSKKE